MLALRERFPSLPDGGLIVSQGLAGALAVTPDLTVAEWADAHRHVAAESGSPRPGRWRTELVPYAREVMDACSVDHPARSVTIRAGAQSAKSEIALNAVLHTIDQSPRSIMILLPSGDEVAKYNRVKLTPAIEASPRVAARVVATKSRDGDGSTTTFKRFRGGFVTLVGASSSKGLQMTSIGLLVAEEITEYPDDVDGRGHPLDQARARQIAFGDDAKEILVSTTGEEGGCAITAAYEAGDQRRYYVPFPCCGALQELRFDAMAERDGRPVFVCQGCGGHAEEHHRAAMVARGTWLPCFPEIDPDTGEIVCETPAPPRVIAAGTDLSAWVSRRAPGRQRSYHWWQAVSPFASWSMIWAQWVKVRDGKPGGDPKAFYQQILAEPYAAASERPPQDEVLAARGAFGAGAGEVPAWCAMLTGAVDVQADRLEWAVWAWGPGGRGQRVASGIVPGQPQDPSVWAMLDQVLARRWGGPGMVARLPDRWGVDTGYATHEAYAFVRGRSGVLALKGANRPDAPPLAQGSRVRIRIAGRTVGRITPHLVGGHELKKRVYFGLHQAARSLEERLCQPRAIFLDRDATEEDARQLTAEVLREDIVRGRRVAYWEKASADARNEQLDLCVYALALAISLGLDRLSEEEWQARAAQQAPGIEALAPLEELMRSGGAPASPAASDAAYPPPPARAPAQPATIAEIFARLGESQRQDTPHDS